MHQTLTIVTDGLQKDRRNILCPYGSRLIPETGSFETERLEGMLELVSLNGNVVRDDKGQPFHHTHALFSFKKDGQHGMAGGHLKATTVLYTAEIELRPTVGGAIGRKFDPETGTGFWDFKE